MATKWKNTVEPKVKNFLKKGGKHILLSICFGIIAIFFFYTIIDNRQSLNTSDCWRLGILGNLFLSSACFLGLRSYLNYSYHRQMRLTEYTYENWKQQIFRQQLPLCILSLLLLFAALLYFNGLKRQYDYYFLNFASGYVFIFTVMISFFVCEATIISFMKGQLDVLMEKNQEVNQRLVDTAIKAEKEVIESSIKNEKLKVDLISNVSHDLKTPLTSMVGYIDLMKKEELSDTMQDYVEVLSTKAQKLKEMIESLFSLAKTSSGNIALNPEPLNLNRLVEQIYADMEDKINSSDLEFVTELTAADTELITDSSYLYRICQNLIENALKYSAKNTRVFLKTGSVPVEGKRLIRFEITNTAGYRMNFTKEQIVERFARGDEARTSDGNGLGLAIVSTYTSALGGSFDVNLDCDQFKAMVWFEKAE